MPASEATRDRATCWLLFVLAFISYGYFYNGGSWNQNARYDSIFAFVEPGTADFLSFRIDRFLPEPLSGVNTGDWSIGRDGYYSNKAPGTTLLGIPAYAGIYWTQRLAGIETNSRPVEILNGFAINLLITVFPVALSISVFYLLLLKLGNSPPAGLVISLVLAFCTMLWPYSTSLWGHTTAAAFLIFSLYRSLSDHKSDLFFSGFLGGIAVLCDFLSVVPLCLIALVVIRNNKLKSLPYFAGGTIALAALLIYNFICFGSPFALPTDNTNPEFVTKENWLGLFGAISSEALLKLTFHCERGLFYSSPILMLCLIGSLRRLRTNFSDILNGGSLVVVATLILLNASFNGWHGGATVGPRYLIVGIPFFVLGLQHLQRSRLNNLVFLAFVAVSVMQMLATTAVSPIAPDIQTAAGHLPSPDPYGLWVHPNFLNGDLSAYKFPIRLQAIDPEYRSFMRSTTWNAGQLVGLSGIASLVPLFGLLALVSQLFGKAISSKVRHSIVSSICYIMLALSILDLKRLPLTAKKLSSQISTARQGEEQRYSQISRAFPFIGEVYRLKRQASDLGLKQVVLISKDPNKPVSAATRQRLSELLYPLIVDQESGIVLQVEESANDLKLQFLMQ